MPNISSAKPSLNLAVLTVSDRHTSHSDSTGDWLENAVKAAGHLVVERTLTPNNRYEIRSIVSAWIANPQIHSVLVNGGTGFAHKNCTTDALTPLLDRAVEGFGELFRQLSFQQIGSSALQSQAFAGLANKTLIFAMPGSESAAQLAWNELIQPQLNSTQGPCNFVKQLMS